MPWQEVVTVELRQHTLLIEDALGRPALLTTVTYVLGLTCHPCPGLFTFSEAVNRVAIERGEPEGALVSA